MISKTKKNCFHNGRFYYKGEVVDCDCKFCKEGKVSYFEPVKKAEEPKKEVEEKKEEVKQEVKEEVKTEEIKVEENQPKETPVENVSQETISDEKEELIEKEKMIAEPNKKQVKQKAKGKQEIIITD